jgi:FkbM family methyltransferase
VGKASRLKQKVFIDRVPSFSDPTMLGSGVLRRWRENYYGSAVLAAVAKPVDLACRELSSQIEKKVKKNGAAISLPNGRTMRIGCDAGVSIASLLYWNGLDSYEVQTSRTLRFFFERATTFVDVGANYGFYSVLAALWNPQLRVTSFEPVPQIYEGLTRNLVLNNLQQRVSAYQLALADRTGSATFYLPGTDSKDCETTGTLVTDGWQSRKHSPEIEVETVLFDDFERSHPTKVDLVKIDVEDFEAAVLAGMARTIRSDRPLIICEVLPRPHRNEKTKQIVESLGYTPYWITSSGYIRVSRFDFERNLSQDFLLSPVSVPGEVVTDTASFWDR